VERRSSIFPPNSKFLRPSVLDLLVQLGQTDWQTGGRTALFRSTSPQGGRIKGNNTVSFTCRQRPSKLVTIVSIVPSITHLWNSVAVFSVFGSMFCTLSIFAILGSWFPSKLANKLSCRNCSWSLSSLCSSLAVMLTQTVLWLWCTFSRFCIMHYASVGRCRELRGNMYTYVPKSEMST